MGSGTFISSFASVILLLKHFTFMSPYVSSILLWFIHSSCILLSFPHFIHFLSFVVSFSYSFCSWGLYRCNISLWYYFRGSIFCFFLFLVASLFSWLLYFFFMMFLFFVFSSFLLFCVLIILFCDIFFCELLVMGLYICR